jgi:TfoX/Sxy family transcriptional regulator of competence genes
MAWKKVSPAVCEILEESLAGFPAEKRKMFGSPTFFINNNMFAGAHEENLILRLTESDRRAIREENDEIVPFEPMAGRPMKEYVAIPEPLLAERDWLMGWIERSFSFASSLPPKEKKKKK